MSITITTTEPTLDEVEDEIISLYYMQRVNNEAADELGAKAAPFWGRIPKGARLRDVATKPANGPTRMLYDRAFLDSTITHSMAFNRTSGLHLLLEPDMFPSFQHDVDDAKKEGIIEAWINLIGLSTEASEIHTLIRNTGFEIDRLRSARPHHQSQDYRGWYVNVSTSRRNTTGWVVGGRGTALHVMVDPLAAVERMILRPGDHRPAVTGAMAVRASARLVYAETAAPEVEKYSLKTATIRLLLPPAMATERKEWGAKVQAAAFAHRDAAKDTHRDYVKWQMDTEPIIKRQKAAAEFNAALPTDFMKSWVEEGELRWVKGGKEAFAILFSLTSMSNEDLREAVTAAHILANPELVVTDAEAALVANPPANGAETFDQVLAKTVRATVGTKALAPLF